ncbi:hypothetical protein DNU06_11030 [Putridiphycobacter roseus]|uniref:CDP-diacylglycerol--serine O-phosphatidyltransferase n=1 Tax=Putridiphycobacter roseus TaxID=2219161 RepID=A0A2W1NBT5_9FLAO|nr:CDP-alcohol phosphatidyltransferase family protein [Putridiphycobacter roseus]PZE16785.1 hypothetical protein DNU06_11030 [Putridiphycobacter roseus]
MAKKRRAVPNFFTIGNLMGGILSILFALTGKIEWSGYCIFVAIVFDFFDGFMAGLLRVKSDKGKQMDSLADIVTFGVSPGFLMFSILTVLTENELNIPMASFLEKASVTEVQHQLFPSLAFLLPIFALFRLAKFNVDTHQSTSFLGVPTATMAIFFAAFPFIIHDAVLNPSDTKSWIMDYILLNPFALAILILVFSVLMVSRIPLFALKFKNYDFKNNQIQYLFLIFSIGTIILFKYWAVPIIVLVYIFISVWNIVFQTKSNKK